MLNNIQHDYLPKEFSFLFQRDSEMGADNTYYCLPNTYGDFVFENSDDSILIINPHTKRILDANPATLRSLGYTRQEICELKIDQIEMKYQQDTDLANNLWGAYVNNANDYQCLYRHKSGALKTMQVRCQVISHDGQKVLVNFVKEINKQQSAEGVLPLSNSYVEQQIQARAAELTAKLALEKENLEAVLSSITEAIAMTAADKTLIYTNDAFAMITGFTPTETQGCHVASLFEFSQRDEESQAEAFAKGESWFGEVSGVRKDGRTFPTILTIAPITSAEGQLQGYTLNYKDLSYFKAIKIAQDKFITNVSHQLRTPLTNIKLYTELLNGNLNNEKGVRYQQTLSKEAQRLEDLVQNILNLANLDSKKNVFEWCMVDLADILPQIIEDNQERASQHEQSLQLTMKEVPMFIGDPAKLDQAFNELIDNALRFTQKGGTVAVNVQVSEENERRWISVAVQDDGPGITFKEQPHVFERFFRGYYAEKKQITGTGIGLSIAQQIAHTHHGYIALQSVLGEGSKFTVWLPVDTAG